MDMNHTLIFYNDSELLEGPVYDATYNYLYFVSILDGTVYFLDISTKEISSVKLDTPSKKVAKYNYDIVSGNATFDSYIKEFKGKSSPDGMCIDQEDMLWIAEWGGNQVSIWNPKNGKMIDQVKLPCPNVSSCCLDNFGNLFVTTAKSNHSEDAFGGGLFYINLTKNLHK